MKLKLISVLTTLVIVATANGQIVFNFIGDDSTIDEYDQNTSYLTVDGLTLNAHASTGKLSATNSYFGINAEISGDETAQFDAGEYMTFSFSQDVRLESIAVNAFGGIDLGQLSFDGGPTIATVASTGATSLNGTFLAQGSSLTFLADSGVFSLKSITVSAIPEPSTYAAIIAVFALGAVAYRRRRQQQATKA